MPLSTSDVAAFNVDDIQSQLIEGLIKTDNLLALLPKVVTDKPVIQVNISHDDLAGTNPFVAGSSVTCATSLSSASVGISAVDFQIDTYARQVDVCDDVQSLYSSYFDQTQAQIMLKNREIGHAISAAIATDLSTFAAGGQVGQVYDASVGTLALKDLDIMIDKYMQGGEEPVFVCNATTRATISALIQSAAGGLGYVDLAGGAFNAPSYRGIPFVINQFLTDGDLFLIELGNNGAKWFWSENKAPANGVLSDGLVRVELVGTSQTAISKIYRVSTRGALVVPSKYSLVKAGGITV